MIGWMLLSWALAAKPAALEIEAEWLALQHLELDTERYRIVEQPLVIHDGPVTLTITKGVMIPVFSGHFANDRSALRKARADAWKQGSFVLPGTDTDDGREFVGFVFTAAEATYAVDFAERAQGLVWATHQVRDLRANPEDWRDVAHGAPWRGSTREGLVLSIDPQLQAQFLGPAKPDQDPDPFDIVVYDDRPPTAALIRAKTLLQSRRQIWTEVQLEPGRWMAEDRLAETRALGDATGSHGLIEFRVQSELGLLGFTAETQPRGLRWMSLLIDERGELDPRKRSILAVIDRDQTSRVVLGPVTGEVFPLDKHGVPRAQVRMVGEQAQVRIVAVPRASDIPVTFEADLQLKAVGGPIQWFSLNLPRAAVRLDFSVSTATLLDGTSVLSDPSNITFDRSFRPTTGPDSQAGQQTDAQKRVPGGTGGAGARGGAFADNFNVKQPLFYQSDTYLNRTEAKITIALPQPLPAGESVVIHLQWRDVWPYGNMKVTPHGFENLIPGTGMQRVFPRPQGTTANNPWRFTIATMTPADRSVVFALPGDTLSQKEENGWFIQQSTGLEHAAVFTEVAASAWKPRTAPAQAGMPAVETYVSNPKEGDVLAVQFRQIANFYQGYLPEYPWSRQVVFEGPAELSEYHWLAGHTLTQVMRTSVSAATPMGRFSRQVDPKRLFAHNVARHWWGQLVQFPHAEDFWMSESLSESFACAYLAATEDSCEALLDRYANTWQQFDGTRTPRASLTEAYTGQPNQGAVVYDYGTYVMHRMLQRRIGHGPYHQALDFLAREHAYTGMTTEHLQDAMSLTSGQDLSDFFDVWVYAGFIPRKIELDWWMADGQLRGQVTSDLPFGTFDVQIAIDDQRVWVDVIDGEGRLAIDLNRAPESVTVDPDQLTLTNHRRAQQVPSPQ